MSRASERIENFNKAFMVFAKAVNAYRNETENILYHLALTQSFEICFELALKVLKDILNENGMQLYMPKQVIKEAFNNELIKNGQVWIDMLDTRNSTSNEYNMDKVNLFLKKISCDYYAELCEFKGLLNE